MLAELEAGTLEEQIAQGEAAVRTAEGQAQAQQVALDKLRVVAPRAGWVDSLPYELGDEAPLAHHSRCCWSATRHMRAHDPQRAELHAVLCTDRRGRRMRRNAATASPFSITARWSPTARRMN